MKLYQCLLIKNRWYKSGNTISKAGIVVHSSGANNSTLKRYVQPAPGQSTGLGMVVPQIKTYSQYDMLRILGTNQYANDWNRANQPYCMHAFVGELADGTVAAVQTLPWASFLWGCGSGRNGSYNSSHIQFEICEDTSDAVYTKKAYQAAAELCAHLCKSFNIHVSKIVSHNEAGKTGYASTHIDPEHWWGLFGYSMDGFRTEVQRILDEDKAVEPSPAPAPEPEKKPEEVKPEKVVVAKARNKKDAYRRKYTVNVPDAETVMRADAGKNKPQIKTIDDGETVTCYGYYSNSGSAIWLYVVDKTGQEGFVNLKELE